MLNSVTQRILAATGGDLDAYEALFAGTIGRLQLFLRVRLGAQIRNAEESLDLVLNAAASPRPCCGRLLSPKPIAQ